MPSASPQRPSIDGRQSHSPGVQSRSQSGAVKVRISLGASSRGGPVTAIAGHLRQGGRHWSHPSKWAGELAHFGTNPQPRTLHESLSGVFAAVSMTTAGNGWVASDPLGLRCLYQASNDQRFVVSTRACLAAEALTGTKHPPRNGLATAWLAASSYHIGEDTGFEGVRVLHPGESLRFISGEPVWERVPGPFDSEVPERPVDDLARELIDDVSDALHAALNFPTARTIINLTGGKDSRLILAVAMHAGIHREFEYETVGPPDLADVQIAEEITRTLGLRHETRFIGLRPPGPYSEMVGTFIQRTGGLVNAWDASTPSYEDEIRITGVCGEALRSFQTLRSASDPTELAMDESFPRRHFGRLGLLHDKVADRLHSDLMTLLRSITPPQTSTFDRVNDHYLRHRLRYTRLGPRGEISGETIQFQPLNSIRAISLGRALNENQRQAGLLFAEVMRMACGYLVNAPLASGPWAPLVQEHLKSRPTGPAVEASDARPPAKQEAPRPPPLAADGDARSLVQRLFADAGDERTGFLSDAVQQSDDACWSIFDHQAVETAISRWQALSGPERRALFGVATGLTWNSAG